MTVVEGDLFRISNNTRMDMTEVSFTIRFIRNQFAEFRRYSFKYLASQNDHSSS